MTNALFTALVFVGKALTALGAIFLFVRLNLPVWLPPVLLGVGATCWGIGWRHGARLSSVPHPLEKVPGRAYLCGGVLMKGSARADGGLCLIDLFFENQHSTRRLLSIELVPAPHFLMKRAPIAPVALDVQCPGLAAMSVTQAIPVPRALQGSTQRFEIIASASAPEGTGKRELFHHGESVPLDVRTPGAAAAASAIVGGVIGHGGRLTKPACISFDLPRDVAEEFPSPIAPIAAELARDIAPRSAAG